MDKNNEKIRAIEFERVSTEEKEKWKKNDEKYHQRGAVGDTWSTSFGGGLIKRKLVFVLPLVSMSKR